MRTIRATLHHGTTREVTYYATADTVTPHDVVAALAATAYGTSLSPMSTDAAEIADALNRRQETGRGWVHLEILSDEIDEHDAEGAYLARAARLGRERGTSAAGWAFDGNTSDENYRTFLTMIDDGDPALGDVYTPPAWLSGEWADDPTPDTLGAEIGLDRPDPDYLDEIATAYEDAADAAYWAELERVARLHTEG